MATTPTTAPWWSNLVSLLVALIVGIGTGMYIAKVGFKGPGGGGGGAEWIKTTLLYVPHALILFGFIADMLTYEGVYWIPSFITLVITPVMHKLFSYVWKGAFDVAKSFNSSDAAPAPAPMSGGERIGPGSLDEALARYTGCDIQGFGWAHSPYGAQTLAIIATFFSYYVIDLANNRSGSATIAPGLFGAVFYILQFVLAGDCTSITRGETPISRVWQFILPLIEGLFVGGVSYSVVQGWYPSYLPSAAISPFPRVTPGELRDGKFDKDGNPWVCVNGNCYPDMSTSEARNSFAQMAAASTGNGQAATAANCPAS